MLFFGTYVKADAGFNDYTVANRTQEGHIYGRISFDRIP